MTIDWLLSGNYIEKIKRADFIAVAEGDRLRGIRHDPE